MTQSDMAYETFFRFSVDLLCIANTEGYFEVLNSAWEQTLGWTLEELYAKPFLDFVHPDDVESTMAEVVKLSQGHSTISFENRYKTADGGWRWLNWTCGPASSTGKLYAIARDVTRNKDLLRALVEAREAAEQANTAKSQFLANMSHELRTPLNAIIGYSEMLMEDAQEDGNQQYVQDLGRVRTAGRHLLGLINQVLDLAKVESGRVDLYFEEVSAAGLCQGVLDTLGPLLEQNGNTVEIDVGGAGTVVTDQVRLRQIVLNVVSNATKFCTNGTIRVSASRVVGSDGPMLRIQVADEGIGMTEDQVQRIFEPFVQADPSTTRKFGGTGLGMAIARHLVHLLGGRILVKSTLGKGTTVTIYVPPQVAEAEAPELPTPERRAPEPDGPLILVVDDDADARNVISRALEKGGYRVITADNGKDGVARARQLRPALITLDIMMPVEDGWSALEQIRADEEIGETPVMMCSVLDEHRLAFAIGADAYVTKPIQKTELLEEVQRLLPTERCDVLIVDDDPDARELLGRRVSAAGHTPCFAVNGSDALEHIERDRPHLILLDLMMPVMDGFEVLRRLRGRDDELSDVPVVVVTAREMSRSDQKAFPSVQAVLHKGVFDPADLLAAVEAALEAS